MNIDENLHLEKYSIKENKDFELNNMSYEEKAFFHTGLHILENRIIEKGREL